MRRCFDSDRRIGTYVRRQRARKLKRHPITQSWQASQKRWRSLVSPNPPKHKPTDCAPQPSKRPSKHDAHIHAHASCDHSGRGVSSRSAPQQELGFLPHRRYKHGHTVHADPALCGQLAPELIGAVSPVILRSRRGEQETVLYSTAWHERCRLEYPE